MSQGSLPWQLYVAMTSGLFLVLWPLWHMLDPGRWEVWEGGHRARTAGPRHHRHLTRRMRARLARAVRGIMW